MKNKKETKSLILSAAERMFAEKGFDETKITDIASTVGIQDSTIYEHFKNKQDILQKLPIEKSKELIKINAQNIRGIDNNEITLRKLVWNYIEYLVDNPNYCDILLFNLRTNKEFYIENKIIIESFIEPYKQTIINGQNCGDFRRDIAPALILKLIFGAIDLLILDWIIKGKRKNPLELFDSFFTLVKNAIMFRRINADINDKRKLIIETAEKIFADQGYEKTRIQDIAKYAGIGDGTIYQYFQSKEEILFSIPIEKTKIFIKLQKEHLDGLKQTEQKLIVMISDYLRYLDLNRNYSSILFFELRFNKSFYKTEAYTYFLEFNRSFFNVILEGKNSGYIAEYVNPYLAVHIILGLVDHCLLTWLLYQKPESMLSLCDPICKLFITAIRKNNC